MKPGTTASDSVRDAIGRAIEVLSTSDVLDGAVVIGVVKGRGGTVMASTIMDHEILKAILEGEKLRLDNDKLNKITVMRHDADGHLSEVKKN